MFAGVKSERESVLAGRPCWRSSSKGDPSPSRAADPGAGVPRGAARRVLSGTIPVLRAGLLWPAQDLPHRFGRWSQAGVFARPGAGAPSVGAPPGGPPAHAGTRSRRIGRPRGGLPAKRPAVCAAAGHPLTCGSPPVRPAPVVPPRSGRPPGRGPADSDAGLSKRCTLTERLCGSLTDGRRLSRRDARCAHPCFRALCLAAAGICWV